MTQPLFCSYCGATWRGADEQCWNCNRPAIAKDISSHDQLSTYSVSNTEELSQSSATFHKKLADTAARVASRKVVVATIEGHFYLFGSWRLIVYKDKEAVRFFWDGREREITVDISPLRELSAPNEWRRETTKLLHREDDDPLRFLEVYLTKKYWADQLDT